MFELVVFQGDKLNSKSSAYLMVKELNRAAGQEIARNIKYSDLIFSFTPDGCSIFISKTQEPIEKVAKEFYVRDYRGRANERFAIANYLHFKGLKVYNSDSINNEPISKLEQYVVLQNAGIPIPNSLFAGKKSNIKNFNYPCVVKSITASNNRLNFLAKTRPELIKALDEIGHKAILQEFIENDGDYKVVIMYGKPMAVYKREEVNMYTAHYRPKRVAVSESDVSNLALRVAKTLGREFCGVDIVREKKTGNLFVLECNFNAGLYMAGIGLDKELFHKAIDTMQTQ